MQLGPYLTIDQPALEYPGHDDNHVVFHADRRSQAAA
jgi:hypothetical protein